MKYRVRVVIYGRVQGVGFRAWTVATAQRHSVDGWVRNRIDGTVEAVFVGTRNTVEAMVAACREGPVAAEVAHIMVEETQESVSQGFISKPTV